MAACSINGTAIATKRQMLLQMKKLFITASVIAAATAGILLLLRNCSFTKEILESLEYEEDEHKTMYDYMHNYVG
jgi:hypothetical protein